jgi:putative Holliday junction resolvase
VTSRRLLGIDFGEKRIGIAVSDGSLAVPLTIVEHEVREADIARVAALVEAQDAASVVVGLPLLASGNEGEQARRCRRFGEALARRLDVPVVFHDETLSTATAATAVASAGNRSRNRDRIDDLAAVNILQSYLDENGARA